MCLPWKNDKSIYYYAALYVAEADYWRGLTLHAITLFQFSFYFISNLFYPSNLNLLPAVYNFYYCKSSCFEFEYFNFVSMLLISRRIVNRHRAE